MIHALRIEVDSDFDLAALIPECDCDMCEALVAHLALVLEQASEAGCKTSS